MFAVSAGARWTPACEAGRAEGMRATEARSFTGRRNTGRATGLGAATFLLAAGFGAAPEPALLPDIGLRTGFFALAAAFLRGGFLPLPGAFDLPLAMLATCYPPIAHRQGTFTQRTGVALAFP